MSWKCEKCGHEPIALVCPACGEGYPGWVKFCPHCGAAAARPETPEADAPAERRLCPDGDCIGILDAAGRCTVCGAISSTGLAS